MVQNNGRKLNDFVGLSVEAGCLKVKTTSSITLSQLMEGGGKGTPTTAFLLLATLGYSCVDGRGRASTFVVAGESTIIALACIFDLKEH